jgi:hypothetical protein
LGSGKIRGVYLQGNEAARPIFRAWLSPFKDLGASTITINNTKLTIIGGGLSGQTLDVAAVRALATLPSLDELRSKIIGLLNAPATKLAVLLQTPGSQLARVLAAHAEAGGAGQVEAAAEAAPEGGETDGAAEPAAATEVDS